MPANLGVVAVQGDFDKHLSVGAALGASVSEVRASEDLRGLSHLVIPGGESTTVGLLMRLHGLGEAIRSAAEEGLAILGTCMGMILMAREVEGLDQYRLDLLDVTVRRNAFGAQVHSFEDQVYFEPLARELEAVFIRAPIVTHWGESVEPIATYRGQIVGVRSGRRVGISFHPELTEDHALHRWFLDL